MTTENNTIIATDVWKGITVHKEMLNEKWIGYSSDTVFLVQVGKGKKGGYTTKASFRGKLYPAANYYNGINIGLGFKKRLVMCGQVLAVSRS